MPTGLHPSRPFFWISLPILSLSKFRKTAQLEMQISDFPPSTASPPNGLGKILNLSSANHPDHDNPPLDISSPLLAPYLYSFLPQTPPTAPTTPPPSLPISSPSPPPPTATHALNGSAHKSNLRILRAPVWGGVVFSVFVGGGGGGGGGVDDGFESKIDIGAGDELGLDACFFLLVLW